MSTPNTIFREPFDYGYYELRLLSHSDITKNPFAIIPLKLNNQLTEEVCMGKIAKSGQTLYNAIERDWKNAGHPVPMNGLDAARGAEMIYRFERHHWPFEIKLVAGNRYTWVRSGVMLVNPNRYGGELLSEAGWAGIVHGIGHWIHQRYNPKMQPHCTAHARLERRLQRYVLDRLIVQI